MKTEPPRNREIPFFFQNDRVVAKDHENVNVGQGSGSVSVNKRIGSESFVQCSATLVVSSLDGAAFLIHAEPEERQGQYWWQEEFEVFADHVCKIGGKLIAVHIKGDNSFSSWAAYRMNQYLKTFHNTSLMETEPIHVPCGPKHRWGLLYDPIERTVTTNTYDNEGPFTQTHQPPELAAITHRTSTSLSEEIHQKRRWMHYAEKIDGYMRKSKPDELRVILAAAEAELGPEGLKSLLNQYHCSWEDGTQESKKLTDFSDLRYVRLASSGKQYTVLDCIEILTEYDEQTDEKRYQYAYALLDCALRVEEQGINPTPIVKRADRLTEAIQDQRLKEMLEDSKGLLDLDI